ncbi:MAG: bifunctional proline dehydrogenase/L-glutamate gamma-semialdehyde dehydrogenase PutA [Alphaproteobacteria bacterium]
MTQTAQLLQKRNSAMSDTCEIPASFDDFLKASEAEIVGFLQKNLQPMQSLLEQATLKATPVIAAIRQQEKPLLDFQGFLREFSLNSEEGIALMSVAEALLRVEDEATINRLLEDKLVPANWPSHIRQDNPSLINMAARLLNLSGRILQAGSQPSGFIDKAISRLGEPVIRMAMQRAMQIMGRQFVVGRNINAALEKSRAYHRQHFTFSYDMLGEGARTLEDAERYFAAYSAAVEAIGATANNSDLVKNPGISVKLSALHPHYNELKAKDCVPLLTERLLLLAQQAAAHNIGLTVDAEESWRLPLSLEIIERVATAPTIAGWQGLGLAVQAYQKRCLKVVEWAENLARKRGAAMMVRLVKGAYWDGEIKRAQEMGLENFPVFTRKLNTDISYLAAAQRLFAASGWIYPQFATHNAYTVEAIGLMAGDLPFEYQKLFGMGDDLYQLPREKPLNCRIYAPVGSYQDLLPYLVRRLLENGANGSFVHQLYDVAIQPETLAQNPLQQLAGLKSIAHPNITLSQDLFGKERRNSKGHDWQHRQSREYLLSMVETACQQSWQASPLPLLAGQQPIMGRLVTSPINRQQVIGQLQEADIALADKMAVLAEIAAQSWNDEPVEVRAACLERVAEALEESTGEILALLMVEAGKTLTDSLAELREAVDFCRYYAQEARKLMAAPLDLPGPTGEKNALTFCGRGVFLCISPWNFPLAIFIGQIAAALVTGNAVVAKPAEQTPLIAAFTVALMHRVGVPEHVLVLVPGAGETVGAALVKHPAISGVVFTGSTTTARAIQTALANREGAIIPLIAETGGMNVMAVDNTALPEQVVDDVLASAFQSAGQRCSALRILALQEEVAAKIIPMLQHAASLLRVGNPLDPYHDIGPVIDEAAREKLQQQCLVLDEKAVKIFELPADETLAQGCYFSPRAYEISQLPILNEEIFGPVLQIYRFKDMDQLLDEVNALGYGLTFGLHSRLVKHMDKVSKKLKAGNIYVNRNMIGAVVGVQPFGGEGLSGTGPKAGGPHYLHRFCAERTLTINTAAAGGNAALMANFNDLADD